MMKKTPFDIITLVIMMIICMRKELLGDDYNYVQMVGLMLVQMRYQLLFFFCKIAKEYCKFESVLFLL